MKTKTLGIAFLTIILLLNFMTFVATADVPSEPHNADAMWVEPSSVAFDASNASVGSKFNVTVWLNMTEDIFAYQVGMLYNRTQLKCTRAAYTAGATSNYFAGHTTSSPPPVIDTSFLGNGSILAMESCLGDDNVTGPHSGTLIWAEFQVLIVPAIGNLTSKFDITTKYPVTTWVKDPDLNKIAVTTYDAAYKFIGPTGPKPLSVSISPASALVAVNQSLLFESNVTGGTPAYSYQWFLNDTAVLGANSSSWTFSSTTNGTYTVYLIVMDSVGGTVKSNIASVTVVFRLLCDVDGDGVVDGSDLALAAWSLGSYGPNYLYPSSQNSIRWNPNADVNGDGVVDGLDLVIIVRNFGKGCSP